MKLLFQFSLPFFFIAILHILYSDDIEEGEKELYNIIPNIKVYNTDNLLKDNIIISGRTPQQILGRSKFIISGFSSSNIVREYYKKELGKYGWEEIKIEKINNKNNLHYGDSIIFQKGKYEISLNIYPPLNTKWSRVQISLYLKNQDPYYNIYVEKRKTK